MKRDLHMFFTERERKKHREGKDNAIPLCADFSKEVKKLVGV